MEPKPNAATEFANVTIARSCRSKQTKGIPSDHFLRARSFGAIVSPGHVEGSFVVTGYSSVEELADVEGTQASRIAEVEVPRSNSPLPKPRKAVLSVSAIAAPS
jgi:hypothetical protein